MIPQFAWWRDKFELFWYDFPHFEQQNGLVLL